METNNDYFDFEELPKEEKVLLFQEIFMTDKADLLYYLKRRRSKLEEDGVNDVKHSSAFYHTLLSLMDRFIDRVDKMVLFDNSEDFWAYSYEITSYGIDLLYSHFCSLSFDKNKNLIGDTVDEEFTLLSIKCKMLTVDEYAKLYDIENVTVRQWIRRGKLRSAKKYGNVWRIPELTDYPERGYKTGQYRIDENAIFPEKYAFISKYCVVSVSQDKKDKTKYHFHFHGKDPETNKSIECDAKGRESIELLLMENPFVRYISDYYGLYSC